MDNVATASINNLRISEADFVPSSEQSITVSLADLRQIITSAVQKAIQPLQDRVESLEFTVTSQGEDLAALKADERLDHDDIRDLFEAIASLEQTHIQPTQKDRGEILRALITANGGKMLAKEARQKMHLGKEQFSLLISKMDEYIETKQFHQDRRQLVLIIK
jgi:hypothetical protein